MYPFPLPPRRYEIFAEQGYEVAQYNAAWLLHHGVSWRAASVPPAATTAGSGEDGAVSALDSILALVGEPSLQEGRTATAAHVSRADAAKALRLFGLSAGQGNVHARIHIGDYHYYGQVRRVGSFVVVCAFAGGLLR